MESELNDVTLLICFALKEEAAPFRKIAAGKSGISILLTGIGRQNAEKSLREFLLVGERVPWHASAGVSPARKCANRDDSRCARDGLRSPNLC